MHGHSNIKYLLNFISKLAIICRTGLSKFMIIQQYIFYMIERNFGFGSLAF